MNKIAIAIHGGAEDKDPFVEEHAEEYKEGLIRAIEQGYQVLKKGGSAMDAVEAAVVSLEDNPLFNAGRGSALNARGEAEMDAAIMCGKTLRAGAVSMVCNVKNPISLARIIIDRTDHVFLSGYGALDLAKDENITLETDSYFITDYQFAAFQESRDLKHIQKLLQKKLHGTVGAVALDKKGNIASATSTGGTPNSLPGRIGDSCVIGSGCYANNKTCAVSGTGTGEHLIRATVASAVSFITELQNKSLQEACDEVIHQRLKFFKDAEVGVISVNTHGEIGIAFNTELMKRAWIGLDGKLEVHIK
ncbi:isoaspartyl peptidase/L-asparaginase family protein [Legionella sp. CNM-1927-20]|uniref:isoaspartyl peptidase/L-asparaginase family protein n=1 Tax=Legionella sp. CNM-1927-20 TaxID=3422221 RepID=UPI00403AC9D5